MESEMIIFKIFCEIILNCDLYLYMDKQFFRHFVLPSSLCLQKREKNELFLVIGPKNREICKNRGKKNNSHQVEILEK